MVCFNKSLGEPAWLFGSYSNRNTTRGQRYYRNLWRAQPKWADVQSIRAIYLAAKNLRRAGFAVHVDHIVPLNHPLVCGLHVSNNLRIIPADENMSRKNSRWPNMPFEQPSLFDSWVSDPDFELCSISR